MFLKSVVRLALNNKIFTRNCSISAESSNVYTAKLNFVNEKYSNAIPTYRILANGDAPEAPNLNELKIADDTLVKMYSAMLTLNVMDKILYESQRQGRISFYMTNFGEEAVQIASAAALASDDLIFAQYRESGILLWRGFTIQDFVNQCYGNVGDKNKGRQMPVHYGSKAHHFVTLSSPLATQIPQAVGAAYGFKYMKEDKCVTCYFGEGAASEGDAHAALNFASTLSCPVLFICRNNGYAISTPHYQQYGGDGIAAKGLAYGINTIRVDGNDTLAMYKATEFARDFVTTKKRPVLIEAMTYRIGHHSTSDDSTAYRSTQEINLNEGASPLLRLRKYLEQHSLWSQEKEDSLMEGQRMAVVNAISAAEKLKKPKWEELFLDVYSKTPKHIEKQMLSMENQLRSYPAQYNISQYSEDNSR